MLRKTTVTGVEIGLLLIGVLLVTTPGLAGTLDASWSAPTTNTDGSLLTDLVSYRVYYGPSGSPCPGSSSLSVVSPTSSPSPDTTVSLRLTGLTTGTLYNVAVTAVDGAGRESGCSSVASAVARAEFSVSPTGTINFGTIKVGSYAEQTFTVSNTGGGTISGSAAVAAPFSVTSGSSFTLGGLGATQAVRVRFTPTTTTTVSTTLSFTANGSTVSVIVTGTGASNDTTAPSVTITSPTSSSTYTATGTSLTLGGTASDNVGVTKVTWANNLGGSGTASGTTSWAASIPLKVGSNVLTVTASDAAGNSGAASLTVTVTDSLVPADVTGPVISKLSLSVTSSGATIGWRTNEPADTQVEYGRTTAYGTQTPLSSALVTSHSQAITGLASRTWYHVRVRSRDAAGNLTVSKDIKFKTR